MSIQEAASTVSGREQKTKGSRRHAAIAAGAALLAVTAGAIGAAHSADTLCHTSGSSEAVIINDRQQPGFCDGYEGFKADVANGIEDGIGALVPDVQIIDQPVFDPNAHHAG